MVLLLLQGVLPSSAANNFKEVESTDSPTAVTAITSDDFDTCSLDPIWTFQEGVAGDPAPAFDGTNLILSVPEGVDHDIWEEINASRVVQVLPEGDFGVEVKFNSEMDSRFQTRGIIVEDGNGSAIRVETYHDGMTYRFYAASLLIVDETITVTEHFNVSIGTSNPMYMRLQRTGTTWTASYSLEGTTWVEGEFEDTFVGTLIGPYIGNTSTSSANPPPAHTGLIDYFYDMDNPGPGDSGVNSHDLAITVAAGEGTVSKDPDKASYGCSEEVSLTPVPDSALWEFSEWGGDATGSDNPLTVTMDADKTITATFIESGVETYTLTVNTVGNGTVTQSPESGPYPDGEEVELTATPDEGWQFDGWSGDLTVTTNPATIIMDSDKTVTATFSEIPEETYTLTVNIAGSGLVEKSPEQDYYTTGTVVTLTPVPTTNWVFTGWSGDATGATTPLQVVMDSNKTIEATFTETFELSVGMLGQGEVTVTPEQARYTDGTVVTVLAVPDTGWLFSGWNGDLSGTQNPTQITMNANHSIIASFEEEIIVTPELTYIPLVLK